MIKYIIVNGHPRSTGKDSFADYAIKELGIRGRRAYVYSSVSLVKDLATRAGWDGRKTPEARKFLSDMKKVLVNSPWGNLTMKNVEDVANRYDRLNDTPYPTYIFIMVREPKEIHDYVYKYGATAVFVRRDEANKVMGNDSDDDVENYPYHYFVNNNSTLDNLQDEANTFINWLIRCVE